MTPRHKILQLLHGVTVRKKSFFFSNLFSAGRTINDDDGWGASERAHFDKCPPSRFEWKKQQQLQCFVPENYDMQSKEEEEEEEKGEGEGGEEAEEEEEEMEEKGEGGGEEEEGHPFSR